MPKKRHGHVMQCLVRTSASPNSPTIFFPFAQPGYGDWSRLLPANAEFRFIGKGVAWLTPRLSSFWLAGSTVDPGAAAAAVRSIIPPSK